MAKIAIDADGVLCDFTCGFLRLANTIWPGKVHEDYQPTSWDDFDGLTGDEMKKVWERLKATPNFWMSLDAYSSNVAQLMFFLQGTRGHDIWICTSRTPSIGETIARQTEIWLRACGVSPYYNYLGIIPVDNWHDKRPFYKAAGIEFSVDDKTETVESCQTLNGHTAMLLDRAWNQTAKVSHRITSLKEFFTAIGGSVRM